MMLEKTSSAKMADARSRIDARLQQSLIHLRSHGTSSAMVDQFEGFLRAPGTLKRPALIVRCRFSDGAFEHSIVVDNPKVRWRLTNQFLPFMERIRARLAGRADVLVLLSDTMYVADDHIHRFVEFQKRVPLLRADWLAEDPVSAHALAIPDFTVQDVSYRDDLERINQAVARTPYVERAEIIKWRGRLTGPDYPTAENCHLFPRYHLLKMAASFPAIIDARITHYDNFPDTEPARLLRRELDDLLGGAVPETPPWDFVPYKYLLSTDGVVATWKRVANSLWTGSTLLLQHRWNQFFYPGLMAWEHYVPLANDFSDLPQRFAWLQAYPDKAQAIGEAGRLFALSLLTPHAIEEHFLTVVHACAALPPARTT